VFVSDKEPERYYLLPEMDGKARRRKKRIIFQWAIAAGLVASIILAWLLYQFR